MRTIVIYHSLTGTTRALAERVGEAVEADLVEVRPSRPYSRLAVYLIGGLRARRFEADAVEPASIDVSAYDRLVIGTPVWAGFPTPVINAAVAKLQGAHGKNAVTFATCGVSPGNTLPTLRSALAAKGVRVEGEFAFSRPDLRDSRKVERLLAAVAASSHR